jgi:hypothetical protein
MAQKATFGGESAVLEHNVLFTGGVPADSVEHVFRTLASAVGSRALAYPDGEINERRYWIGALKDTVWSRCEGLEARPSELPDELQQSLFPSFRFKPGVTELHLEGLLPYSRAAIESYGIFKRLRAEGVIRPDVRFQIAIPAALDAIALYFPAVERWPALFDAWTRAVQDELRRVLEVIPAGDLVLQIDYCLEVALIDGALGEHAHWVTPELAGDAAFARYTSREYLAPHVQDVPDEVMVGYHICLGTLGGWPRVPLDDIGLPVDLAGAMAASTGRRVDFFHLPVMQDADDRFFAPLERLDVGEAAVYLGVECNDGLEAMRKRIDGARNHLERFGVAHYCGYAFNKEILPQLLSDLRAGADEQAAATGAPQ